MIIPHPEVLLVGGLVGLYLYDSALLLASNEVLLSPDRKGRWHALFGSNNFQLRGKEPFVPNPLLPHRPIYRFSWDSEGIIVRSREWTAPVNRYSFLAPSIWFMFLAIFVLIPLGLLTRLGSIAIASGIILFYVNALIALSSVWFKRSDHGLSKRRFVSLAFECLTCPPFAINLVRHLSLGIQPKEDFLSVVDQCLIGSARDAALSEVIIRIKNEIDWEDESSLRAQTLNSHLQYLSHESDTCREQSY